MRTPLWDPRRPALVPVRLRDLRISEEFETAISRSHGTVADWGYVVDVDERTGRETRVRAVRCRFGAVERTFSAELQVLVPFNRPHARRPPDDTARWATPLDRPRGHDDLATACGVVAGRRVRANRAGETC
jgi:hypothetical protein